MKVSRKPHSTTALPSSDALVQTTGSDLKAIHRATSVTRRKARNQSLTRQRKSRPPIGGRSRPETPLLKWKVEDKAKEKIKGVEDDNFKDNRCNDREAEREIAGKRGRRKSGRPVSVRKFAAGIWRLQVLESNSGNRESRSNDRLGFQEDGGYMGTPFLYHHNDKLYEHQSNHIRQSPIYITTTKNGFLSKLKPSIPFPHSAMEGATKWDPVCLDTMDEVHQIYSNMKHTNHQVNAASFISSLEIELEGAHARIDELEMEKRSQKKKLEQFLRKVSEERVAWWSREQAKVCAIIDDMKADINRESKTRQRLELSNLKLVNELADSKLDVKRYMQDYEKERKARELIEEVCDELAKEIGDDKAEIEALKREHMKFREDIEAERKILQMAEVWREERVQMKLIDAKLALEEKYTQMNKLVETLEAFLMSRSSVTDVKVFREAELLKEAAASVNIQAVKEFSHVPSDPNKIVSVFDEINLGEAPEREIEQCVSYSSVSHASKVYSVSPDANMINKERHANDFTDQNCEIDEDERGWETISHLEEQGSSYSPDGSIPSVNNNHHDNNISISSSEYEGKGYEDTRVTEISEVCSIPRRQSKKMSSIAKLWRFGGNNRENCKIISMDGLNARFSNARKSNVEIVSPERSTSKGEFSQLDLVGQWSSLDSANPHSNRGMKGCIEWPRGAQKNILQTELIEARIGSEKVQLKHVLKQKI